jgi:NhaP-type Na+/H+ or K+/H+ antiporter
LRSIILSSAVVLTTLGAVALVIHLLVPHWTWALCFLFSAGLSANDPVSVVPVMHAAGASHSLTVLILGETLFSEGFATVLYHLFGEHLMGCNSTYNAWNVVQLLIKDFIFSPFIGAFIAYFSVIAMGLVNQAYRDNDTIMQSIIQVFCAYFSFYIAEYEFEVSGVYSVVSAGVLFATMSRSSTLKQDIIETIWSGLEWVASTLFFLFSGLIIVLVGFRDFSPNILYIPVLIFITIGVVRAATVYAISPLLSRIAGEKISFNEFTFLATGGIKGAISVVLVMGLVPYEEAGVVETDDMKQFLLFGGGVILLSQLLLGSATPRNLAFLDLLPKDSYEEAIVNRFLRDAIRKELYAMNEYSTNNTDQSVINMSAIRDLETIDFVMNEDAENSQLRKDIRYLSTLGRPHSHELYRVLRGRYLESVYSLYLHDINVGRLTRNSFAAQTLLRSIEYVRNDHKALVIDDWEHIEAELNYNPTIETLLSKFVEPAMIYIGLPHYSPLPAYYSRTEERNVYILTSFIAAHRRARRRLEIYFQMTSDSPLVTSVPELMLILDQSQELVIDYIHCI